MQVARSSIAFVASLLGAPALLGCTGGETALPSGTLETAEIDLAPATGGRVLEVRFDLGERVSAGDTVLVVDTELLALQREESVATLASIVAQGAAAIEEERSAERSLELAETTLQRLRTLEQQGSATRQQIDEASAARDIASSRASAARHRRAVHQAERERILAAIAVIDRRLEDGVLLAPSAGTVLTRAIEPGEMASPGAPALRIADLSRLDLRVYLEPEALGGLRLGMEIPVRIDALGEERLAGRLEWVSDEAEFTPKNAQTRDARAQLVYAVKISLPNPDGRLHIGMTAEAEIGR